MANPLPPDDIALAHRLRRDGVSWAVIARTLGRQKTFVRCQLDIEFRDHRAMLARDYTRRKKLAEIELGCPKPCHGEMPHRPFVPPEVEADKERRRWLEHSSLTAAHCGDPLPGQSALDQRKLKSVASNSD